MGTAFCQLLIWIVEWLETTFSHKDTLVWSMCNLNIAFEIQRLPQFNCPWWIPQNCRIAFTPLILSVWRVEVALEGQKEYPVPLAAGPSQQFLLCHSYDCPIRLTLCPSNKAYLFTNWSKWVLWTQKESRNSAFYSQNFNKCWLKLETSFFLSFNFILYS